jgi:hypothetical protein
LRGLPRGELLSVRVAGDDGLAAWQRCFLGVVLRPQDGEPSPIGSPMAPDLTDERIDKRRSVSDRRGSSPRSTSTIRSRPASSRSTRRRSFSPCGLLVIPDFLGLPGFITSSHIGHPRRARVNGNAGESPSTGTCSRMPSALNKSQHDG